ncbi:MAG TPA: hypothetical protein DCP71_03580 [Verrucomicrobiales bacterium]|nr:hypothetical protein [Verrucomicrobiales bacterium]
MKTNSSFLFFVTLIVVAFVRSSMAYAEEIPLTACPAPVQETLRSNLHGGTLDEVNLIAIEGRSLYIAEVDLPGGRDLRIHIGPDGSLLKTREEITLAETPAAVQEAVRRLMPAGGRLADVDREVVAGTTTFRVEIDRPQSRDLQLHLAEDGAVLQQRDDS